MAGDKYYSLKNVGVDVGGDLLDVVNFSIKRNNVWVPRSSGRSKTAQQVWHMENEPDAELEFIESDTFNSGMIIANTQVGTFSLDPDDPDTASLLQTDFFSKWSLATTVWGDPQTVLGDDGVSHCKVPLKFGVINPHVAPEEEEG